MTEVEFYHGAPDKLAAACQLAGELYRQGRKVIIYAPEPAVAAHVDRMLWTQPAIAFTPHCRSDSPLAAETPIVITGALDDTPFDEVLVNLDGDLPPSFARFQRLIEVVGVDEADRAPARERYRFYRERGYPLRSRDLSLPRP